MKKYLIISLLTFAVPVFADENKWGCLDFVKDVENIFKSQEEGVGEAWLKIPTGARGTALANAYLNIAEGPTASWWNPAGLIKNSGWSGAFTYTSPFTGNPDFAGNYEFVGVSNKSGKNAYGITLSEMYIPSFETYDEQQHYYGKFDLNNLLGAFSYARAIDRQLTVGASLKGLYERIYIDECSTWLLDFGLMYTPYPNLWLGATAMNLGPSPKFDSVATKLPSAWKLGASYTISNLLFSINTDKYIDEIMKVGFGCEYTPIKYLSLRAGYITGSTTESFSLGFGINWQGFKLDYAFKPYAYNIGASHIITLTR